MDLVMPYFAKSCVDASKQGMTRHRAGYPTRDWFSPSVGSGLLDEPAFRDEFVARAKARHIERLGFCELTLTWPTELRIFDPALIGLAAPSQVLEVVCDWSSEAVERNQPTSNVKGSCPVCLESGSEVHVCALVPCGHLVCTKCSPSFRKRSCPVCRQYCSNVQSLFSSASE